MSRDNPAHPSGSLPPGKAPGIPPVRGVHRGARHAFLIQRVTDDAAGAQYLTPFEKEAREFRLRILEDLGGRER